MKDALSVVKAMRSRLADPSNWCQHFQARTANGDECSPFDRHATCWCIVGAYVADGGLEVPRGCLGIFGPFLAKDYAWVSEFNDQATHQQVLDLLDRTIVAIETDTVPKMESDYAD